jgi:type I restriction enzyme S subunit
MSSLRKLIEIKNGRIASKDGEKYPIFGGNGIIGYSNSFNFENVIIIGRVGAYCGSIHKYSGKCWISDNALAGIPLNNCNDFNYYLLGSINLNKRQIGSSQPLLTQAILYNLELNFNENPITQQKIASVLSALDDKIELNNRINAELEQMAKLLYEYWFVQFDFPYDFRQSKPADETSKPQDIKPYKSSGGKMIWNKDLNREIPEGWEVKELKGIARTGSGGTPLSSKEKYYEKGDIPWINSGEVNKPFIISATKKINQSGLDNSSAKLFPKGTILMAMYGATAGKVSLINFEASTNQAICAIIPTHQHYRYFIKFKLETLYEFLVNLSSGSARDNLSQEKIRELKFAIPDNSLLKIFHKKIESSMNKILENLTQNQELSSLRDWLLPMLMNGQISVMDAEERVSEELGMVAEGERGKYEKK